MIKRSGVLTHEQKRKRVEEEKKLKEELERKERELSSDPIIVNFHFKDEPKKPESNTLYDILTLPVSYLSSFWSSPTSNDKDNQTKTPQSK